MAEAIWDLSLVRSAPGGHRAWEVPGQILLNTVLMLRFDCDELLDSNVGRREPDEYFLETGKVIE